MHRGRERKREVAGRRENKEREKESRREGRKREKVKVSKEREYR